MNINSGVNKGCFISGKERIVNFMYFQEIIPAVTFGCLFLSVL